MKKEIYIDYGKPIAIEVGEWWFKGHIIQKQDHPDLMPYISWPDTETGSLDVKTHSTMKDALDYCKRHPCIMAQGGPERFIGGTLLGELKSGQRFRLMFGEVLWEHSGASDEYVCASAVRSHLQRPYNKLMNPTMMVRRHRG